MSTQHTPGPWNVVGTDLVEAHDLDKPLCICRMAPRTPKESNARLIAAAPELLDVLAGIVDQYESDGGVGPQIIADARAAIAKAEGRAE